MTWILSAFADEAGVDIDAQISALKRANITWIDLRGVEGHNITELPLDAAERVRQRLDEAGIRVNMFGSPIGKLALTDDFATDMTRITHLAKLIDIFDCRAVRIFSYYKGDDRPLAQWQAASLDRLRQLRDFAGENGLVLYHENERNIFGDRCEQVEVLAEELRDGKAFRLIFDFDNYNQSGDDVWANWLKLKHVTDAFHLKDSTAENMHVPVGEGNGQVSRILSDAKQMGWDGPLSLEPHLIHSAAVQATGPSGQANVTYKDMPSADSFHVAAEAAHQVLAAV